MPDVDFDGSIRGSPVCTPTRTGSARGRSQPARLVTAATAAAAVGEGVEEGVALVVDLVAAVPGKRLAHDPPVLGQRVAGSASGPSSSSSFVDPSMSVKSRVTVPDGSSAMWQSCAGCVSMSRERTGSWAGTSRASCGSGVPRSATSGSTCSTPIGSAARSPAAMPPATSRRCTASPRPRASWRP